MENEIVIFLPSSASKIVMGNYNTFISSVDGRWSSWGQYSQCTKSCGGGSQYRTRACDNPVPSSGGRHCPGPSQQSNACNTQGCPGKYLRTFLFIPSLNALLAKSHVCECTCPCCRINEKIYIYSSM